MVFGWITPNWGCFGSQRIVVKGTAAIFFVIVNWINDILHSKHFLPITLIPTEYTHKFTKCEKRWKRRNPGIKREAEEHRESDESQDVETGMSPIVLARKVKKEDEDRSSDFDEGEYVCDYDVYTPPGGTLW